MTRSEVVKTLGAMYDDYQRGTYDSVDDVIAKMENPDEVVYACNWKTAESGERFWIGFDADEVAVGIHWENEAP